MNGGTYVKNTDGSRTKVAGTDFKKPESKAPAEKPKAVETPTNSDAAGNADAPKANTGRPKKDS